MKSYPSSSIRNILLAGHSGAGKTTLAETMLFESGTLKRRGSIEEKNTVSDHHEIEKEKGKSVFTSWMHLDWRGVKINLLDTPGVPDFVGEVINGMKVADAALFILNTENGVEAATDTLWGRARDEEMPVLLLANHLDGENSDFQQTFEMARSRFEREVVLMQYPFSEGADFHAIIDVLRMTMYEFPEAGGRPDKLPIPESQKDQAELLHNELVEAVAENDETLMDLYFENGKLDEYQMREGLRKAILKRQMFPLFCASAARNMGTGRVMGFIGNVLPSPADSRPVKLDGDGMLQVEDNQRPVLFTFKTFSEPHVGVLNYMKVLNGPVAPGMELENQRDQSSQRLGAFSASQGPKRVELTEARAGDLIVTVKMKQIQTNDTLTERGRDLRVSPAVYPEPLARKAIELQREGEEDKLGHALHQIQLEDPTIHVEQSQELKQTILHGLGAEHLSAVLEQLIRRFDLQVQFIPPKIPYRETITRSVKTHYRHKKQSGGAGQYAEVYFLIEPWRNEWINSEGFSIRDVQEVDLPWGGKMVFQNCIVGGVIDNRFMPAICKGIMEKMEEGPMCGCRVMDIRVSVYDGSMHPVDSNEAAFKTAARMAFRDGFMKASPQLMEPLYDVEVLVPSPYMGEVMSDVSSRRGQILGMDGEGVVQKIHSTIPLQELDEYSTRLKSMTQGKASFSQSFSHYAPVPATLQKKVLRENLDVQSV